MKTLEYNISAEKYSKLQTKIMEKTISQINELLGKSGKISIEGMELNLRGDNKESMVKIKVSGNFSKKKEDYVCEIMETFMRGIENENLDQINIFEVDENIDRRIKKGENISELEDYSGVMCSSKVEKYLGEICKLINEGANSEQYLTTLGLRISEVKKDNGEIKNIRNFTLPENVSESRLYTCSMLLKKIIKQVEDEEYYISDGINSLFCHLQLLGLSEQVKPSYDKTIQKIDALKTYFRQLGKGYLSDEQVDKYNLKSLKNILFFLKMHKKECNEILPIPTNYSKGVKNANLLLKETGKKIDYNSISELCHYVQNLFATISGKK